MHDFDFCDTLKVISVSIWNIKMSQRNRLNVFKNVCEMSGQSSIEKGMEGTGCPLLSTPADTLPGNRRVDAPRVGGAGGRVSALPPPTPPVSDAAPPQAVSGAGDVSGLAGGRHSDLSSRNRPSDTPSTSSVENTAHASMSMRHEEATGESDGVCAQVLRCCHGI